MSGTRAVVDGRPPASAERNGPLTRFSERVSRVVAPRAPRGIELPDPVLGLQLTSTAPGSSTGLAARIDFPTAPNGRPYSVREIGIEFPAGFGVEFSAVPLYRGSSRRLFFSRARHRAASVVGSGTARVDFGIRGMDKIGHPVHEIVLGDGCFYSYEHNRINVGRGKTLTVFPLVFTTPLDSSGFLWEIGEAPSFRGPDGLDALFHVTVEFDDTGLFRLPDRAPDSGAWEFVMTFRSYHGSRSRVVVPVPVESS